MTRILFYYKSISNIILLLVLINSFSSCDKKPINVNDLLMSGQDYNVVYNLDNEPYTGRVYENWTNNNLKCKGSIVAGRKHGFWIFYNEQGYKEFEINFDMNYENGTFTKFYKNGKIDYTCEKKNGKRNGEWIAYFESGSKQQEGKYLNEKEDGNWIYYHPNGNVSEKGLFNNGLRTGSWSFFYDNGKIKSIGNFESDLQKGEWKYHSENGNLESLINY